MAPKECEISFRGDENTLELGSGDVYMLNLYILCI